MDGGDYRQFAVWINATTGIKNWSNAAAKFQKVVEEDVHVRQNSGNAQLLSDKLFISLVCYQV